MQARVSVLFRVHSSTAGLWVTGFFPQGRFGDLRDRRDLERTSVADVGQLCPAITSKLSDHSRGFY